MKTTCAAVLLATAVSLAGCKGFWDPLPSSGGTSNTPTTLSSGPFYVLNQKTAQIAAYVISSGTLGQISGSPYLLPASATPSCIAIAPGGGFLYVGTINGVYAYSIAANGGLSILNNGIAIAPDLPLAMQVGPNGTWLIDAFFNVNGQLQLNAIPLNSGGTFATGSTISSVTFQSITTSVSTATIKQMVLSPQADYLFLALGTDGAIAVPFAAGSSNPVSTTATQIATLNSNQSVLAVAVDPQQRLFYLGETNANPAGTSGGLLAFSYSSLTGGAPKQISSSPLASGALSPSAILAESSGSYVYVANGNGQTSAGSINWFSITSSGTSYTITAPSKNSVSSGIFPVGLAEDNQNNFILAVSTGGSTSSGNPDLQAFTMSSGALTSSISSNTGSDPVTAAAIAALP
jgi:6-phosphogluconolactonase (cycloisomerase 2 family)